MEPAAVPVEAAGVLAAEVFPAACAADVCPAAWAAEFAKVGRCQASPSPVAMAEYQKGYRASAQATPALAGLLLQFSELGLVNAATACGPTLDE